MPTKSPAFYYTRLQLTPAFHYTRLCYSFDDLDVLLAFQAQVISEKLQDIINFITRPAAGLSEMEADVHALRSQLQKDVSKADQLKDAHRSLRHILQTQTPT
eukprot:m.201959 g.201959  ORF g.201959 m.201959 type:complete len:102 (-) comp16871_c0_seq8:246-551(-)